MNVVVPYTRLHPDTVAALDGLEPRYVDVSADDEAYWRLFRDLWAARQTFIIVEHDIVPAPGAVRALWDCDRWWCSYPYSVGSDWQTPCLGCAKFSGQLQARFPDLLERVGNTFMGYIDGKRVTGRYWERLDMTVALWLTRRVGAARIQPTHPLEFSDFTFSAVHEHPWNMVEHRHAYEEAI